MKATVGRIVHYILSEDDAASINRHFNNEDCLGNRVRPGEIYPLIICRVWDPALYGGVESINGQVMLDAPFSHWVTSVHPDAVKTPGTWHWPEIPPKPGGDSLSRMDEELSPVVPSPFGQWISSEVEVMHANSTEPVTAEILMRSPATGANLTQVIRDAEAMASRLCELIECAGASEELTACSIAASQLRQHLADAAAN